MSPLHPDYDSGTGAHPSIAMMWTTIGLCALSIAAVIIVMCTKGDGGFAALGAFAAWVFSPFLPLVGMAIFLRNDRPVSIATLIATSLAVALLVLEIHDFLTGKSSTTALVFIIVPVCQWGITLLAIAVAVVIRNVRRRRA